MSPLSAIGPVSPAIIISPRAELQGVGRMATRLPGVELPAGVRPPTDVAAAQPTGDFSSMLGRLVSDVNAKQAAAGQAVSALQSGQGIPLHQAVIAMEEASVSFQLMVEVRNKLLESYQEIMRMQI